MIPLGVVPAVGEAPQQYLIVFLNMHAFCNPEAAPTNMTLEFRRELSDMKNIFGYLQVIFCVIGVTGNMLNLRTLQSPYLQSVPFMYIRALAVFDLISLFLILQHFWLILQSGSYIAMFYLAHFEAPLVNTFLVAGLYCAFMLTVERYTLISRPHFKPTSNPHGLARRKIFCVLLFSALIHMPIMVQSKLKETRDDHMVTSVYTISNNVDLLCSEPTWTIFNYYKMMRECFRFLCVVIMTILNIIIARKLQLNKIRRRRLVRRSSPSDPTSKNIDRNISPDTATFIRKDYTGLARSFAEKKLTALMLAICVIFMLGNIPQIIVMVLQNEAMEYVYGFQLFRNIANLLEVVNHCMNFYVFCTASSEYTRAFLLNCLCLRSVLFRLPGMQDFLSSRRSSRFDSALMSYNASGILIANKNFGSSGSINNIDRNIEIVQSNNAGRNSSSVSEQSDSRLKGILVNSDRDRAEKGRKSLTIVNHLAVPLKNADDDEEETVDL